MKERKARLIPFTKAEWKGKEVDIRTDRLNVKVRMSKNHDEKVLKKTCEEIAKSIKGASIQRFSPKTGTLIL